MLAVGGLGKRQGELSLWHAAGLAERLAARAASGWRKLSAPQRPRSCAWASRTEPTASTAIGRRSRAPGDARGAAERRSCASSRSPTESLRMARDWINTPAHGLRARRACGRRASLAERHQAAVSRMGGRGAARREFPRHSCRRPRQRRGAAAGRAALDAAPRSARRCRASPWSARACASTAAAWISNRVPAWRS